LCVLHVVGGLCANLPFAAMSGIGKPDLPSLDVWKKVNLVWFG